ncbi:MAG TPA: glucose-6-phosphate dehydrogenase [Vicinamibacteria bacterium]|nr:glucose-6-phosphate dehydrogenase [Vicinamibacteria bacterium]
MTTTLVIFGASGDLTARKLVPGLFNLHQKKRLPDGLRIVGFARRDYTDESFRDLMNKAVLEFVPDQFDPSAWHEFAQMLYYFRGNLDRHEDFASLGRRLAEAETQPANRLYYFSVAPHYYEPTVTHLGQAGMANEDGGFRRVVIEKPFGSDLESARELNAAVHAVFEESQIYRIDHYLGKETAQNILFFRFGNTVFEPIWNRNYVDHVQLTVAESVDVGHRARFYDETGVLRDMFQNHLLQLLTLVAMEPPASFDADAVRNEKSKVLSAMRPMALDRLSRDTVRGQYRGYREADGVSDGSDTATYAALKLQIDNWRWQGVPFYLRSGKALKRKVSEILIQFRCPPHIMFPLPPGSRIRNNYLAICVQPDEGMHLRFEAKVPDTVAELRSVDMEFHYAEDFEGIAIPEAYERLLLDALHGDASLFARSDGIELAWKVIDPILDGWLGASAPPLEIYEGGSWGPEGADRLLGREGRSWQSGCEH